MLSLGDQAGSADLKPPNGQLLVLCNAVTAMQFMIPGISKNHGCKRLSSALLNTTLEPVAVSYDFPAECGRIHMWTLQVSADMNTPRVTQTTELPAAKPQLTGAHTYPQFYREFSQLASFTSTLHCAQQPGQHGPDSQMHSKPSTKR